MIRVALIDNNDSFTANLEHLIATATSVAVHVVPYVELEKLLLSEYDLIVISPGPGKPVQYPGYAAILDGRHPVLGICLGMQIMAEYFGGEVSRLDDCIHGKTDRIVFQGRPITVARYHSLYVSRVPECFDVVSVNATDIPMVIQHKKHPCLGYQFHPESFMTNNGEMFINHAFDRLI